MLRWLKFRFCNIKVRDIVTVTLSVLFLLLIFTHGPSMEDDNIFSLHRSRRHSANGDENLGLPKRYSHLKKFQDAQRQNREHYEELKRRLNEVKVRKANKLRPKTALPAVDRDIATIRLELKDKELAIQNRMKNLTGFKKNVKKHEQEGYASNIEASVNYVESYNQQNGQPKSALFNPPEFFTDIKAKVDKIREERLTKHGGIRHGTKGNMSSQGKGDNDKQNTAPDDPSKRLHLSYINKDVKNVVYYKKEIPLIWVTGHPRSGTTLMRAMLDAHPSIRCGEETHIIPKILASHGGLVNNKFQMGRLNAANIDDTVISNAVGAYILTVIAQHGESAQRLCNKDPMTLVNGAMIKHIFPNSKFVFMIRDGRAVVHSIMSRKIKIGGFDRSSYTGALKSWNMIMTRMYYACQNLGPDVCLPVYYEQLVQHPRSEMKKILTFLDIDWDDLVVNHYKTVGKKGGVSLSMKEYSTDQVEKPVNLLSLTSWAKEFPKEALESTREVAPLLEILGYDPDMVPPYYGQPDPEVLEITKELELRKINRNKKELNVQNKDNQDAATKVTL